MQPFIPFKVSLDFSIILASSSRFRFPSCAVNVPNMAYFVIMKAAIEKKRETDLHSKIDLRTSSLGLGGTYDERGQEPFAYPFHHSASVV